MKLIALLPLKNEEWVLPTYLATVGKIADQIIALDDGSTDKSKEILEKAGGTVFAWDPEQDGKVNMSARRSFLLQKGREASGSHFIWLDADETFSANFIATAREKIGALTPGQKIKMPWIFLWKSNTRYVSSKSDYASLIKDFIVCDAPDLSFENKAISEGRTPGNNDNAITLAETEGAVLHFQFAAWEANQLKQAWYRCVELVARPSEAKAINNMYAITLDNNEVELKDVPQEWLTGIPLPDPKNKSLWQLDAIKKLFAEHTITFFEPLDIWHIPALHQAFIDTVGREPKPLVDSAFRKFAKKIKKLL